MTGKVHLLIISSVLVDMGTFWEACGKLSVSAGTVEITTNLASLAGCGGLSCACVAAIELSLSSGSNVDVFPDTVRLTFLGIEVGPVFKGV